MRGPKTPNLLLYHKLQLKSNFERGRARSDLQLLQLPFESQNLTAPLQLTLQLPCT